MGKVIVDEILKWDIVINGNKAQKELFDVEKATVKLRDTNKALRREQRKLAENGKKGTVAYKNLTKEINANSAVIKKNEVAMTKLRDEIGITSLTVNQLGKKAKELQTILKHLTPGSADQKRYRAELDQVKARLGELRGKAIQTRTSLAQIRGGFIKGSAIIASITAVIYAVKRLTDSFIKLSDIQADVQKTTNLSKEAVEDITTELDKLNTRTPRAELLALAVEAGRLGKKSKADVIAFVKAADVLKVALGDDLGGDEAIRVVGKLTEQFQVAEKFGVSFEESLLKMGSAINEVSAAGSVQASYIVDYTQRLIGASTQAGIIVQDQVGYAAVLDESGQKIESSATAVSKVIIDMFKDTETYAEVAEMSIESFTKLLKDDANEAFLQVLEGLNSNNEGLTVMAGKLQKLGLDGNRAVTVLATLAKQTGKIREKQDLANKAMEDGISLTNEYNVKNNNLAANFQKIGNALEEAFVNSSVMSGLEGIVGWMAKMVEIPLAQAIEDEWVELKLLEGQIYATNITQENRTKLIKELQTKYPDYLGNLNAEYTSNAELATALSKVNTQLLNKIILSKKDAEIEEVQGEKAEKLIKSSKAKHKFEVEAIKLREKYNLTYDEGLDTQEKFNAIRKELYEKIDTQESADDFGVLSSYMRDVNINLYKSKSIQEEINELLEEREFLIKDLGIEDPFANKKNPSGNDSNTPQKGDKKYIQGRPATYNGTYWELDKIEGTTTVTDEESANKKAIEAFQNLKTEIAKLERAEELKQKEQYDREVALVEDKYAKLLQKAQGHKTEIAQLETLRDNELETLRLANLEKQALAEEKLEEEKQKEIQRIRNKYGLVTTLERQNLELQALQTALDEKLISEEDYLIALANMKKAFAEKGAEAYISSINKEKAARIKNVESFAQGIGTMSAAMNNLMALEMERIEVVKIAGESEQDFTKRKVAEEYKRKEIEKKYAGIRLLITLAEIAANTALSIMKVSSQLGIYAIPVQIAYGILGATQAGIAIAQNNKIQGYEEGLYPVTDQRGRNFKASRINNPTTGKLNSPTILAGEKPEIIIDPITTKRLEMNSPHIIEAIYAAAGRTRGYETGKYPTPQINIPAQDNSAMLALIAENRETLNQLNQTLKNGIPALYDDKEILRQREQLEIIEQIETNSKISE